MRKTKDLTGKTFGRLTVIKRAENDKHRHPRWHCLCSCGSVTTTNCSSLIAGRSKSCGCLKREKATSHGMRHHPVYGVWQQMKARCLNKKNKRWANYGGRGIIVCARWETSFENFWLDMGPTYKKGMSIDRKDNDGNYEPGNCRWATAVQQNNNRSVNKNNTSGSRGVHWDKRHKKWNARVQENRKLKHIGYFSDKIEAAQARDQYIKANNLPAQLNF